MKITDQWLSYVGILPHGEVDNEFGVRIRGGSDDGWKTTSDQDVDGDEVCTLVLVLVPGDGIVCVYIELYELPSLNTTALIELGIRRSRAEVLLLCKALGAWGIRYGAPEAPR